jgi:hypothetical protein
MQVYVPAGMFEQVPRTAPPQGVPAVHSLMSVQPVPDVRPLPA